MSYREFAEKAIKELEAEEPSYKNCEMLSWMYLVRDGAPARVEGDHIHAGDAPLTKAQVAAWVGSMKNADGTRGGHWTMEQTEAVRKQRGIECDPVMFYAAMNMMYSDYCKAVEKTGTVSVDFYAYMAKAFLDDEDAAPDKLARYYHFVAAK